MLFPCYSDTEHSRSAGPALSIFRPFCWGKQLTAESYVSQKKHWPITGNLQPLALLTVVSNINT